MANPITATNPETGERVALVNGQWVPAGPRQGGPSSAQDREALSQALSQAQSARRTADTAQQFLQYNRRTPTGGWLERESGNPDSIIYPLLGGFLGPKKNSDLGLMNSLTARMLRDNIVPGTSGAMNSNAEQALALSTYPSPRNRGSVNLALARELTLSAQIAEARSQAMDEFVKQRGSLNGFDAEWAPQERALRQAASRGTTPAPSPSGVRDLGVIR